MDRQCHLSLRMLFSPEENWAALLNPHSTICWLHLDPRPPILVLWPLTQPCLPPVNMGPSTGRWRLSLNQRPFHLIKSGKSLWEKVPPYHVRQCMCWIKITCWVRMICWMMIKTVAKCHPAFHWSTNAWRIALHKLFATHRRERTFLHNMVFHTISIATGLVCSQSTSKGPTIQENLARYVLWEHLVQ